MRGGRCALLVVTAVPLLAGPARAQEYFVLRSDAQAHCPGDQVVRAKPPRGAMVPDSDGSEMYGAYACQSELANRAANGAPAANGAQ